MAFTTWRESQRAKNAERRARDEAAIAAWEERTSAAQAVYPALPAAAVTSLPAPMSTPATPARAPLFVNYADIPPQRNVATVVVMTILFGPLGMLTLGAKVGLLATLLCVVAAVVTAGISIVIQIFVLPFIAGGMASSSNQRRAAMLGAAGIA